MVTLGIFSAWAKVRSARYFYGNTYIGDHSFDYHGQPLRILLGRAIAVGILLLYSLAVAFAPALTFILAIGLFFATPWLVNAALRFNARNSSYSNIRFNFTGTYGAAFKAYIGWPLLVALTLGTTYPLARRARTHFNINNHSFGGRPFACFIPGKSIYCIYFAAFGLLLGSMVVLIPVMILGGTLGYLFEGTGKGGTNYTAAVFTGASYLCLALLLMTFTGTRVFNLALNNTVLGGRYRFEASLSAMSMIGLVFGNLLLMLATLGLYYPWARVRTARYVAEHLAVTGAADIGDLTSELVSGQGAIGEEVASFFDVDIGF